MLQMGTEYVHICTFKHLPLSFVPELQYLVLELYKAHTPCMHALCLHQSVKKHQYHNSGNLCMNKSQAWSMSVKLFNLSAPAAKTATTYAYLVCNNHLMIWSHRASHFS